MKYKIKRFSNVPVPSTISNPNEKKKDRNVKLAGMGMGAVLGASASSTLGEIFKTSGKPSLRGVAAGTAIGTGLGYLGSRALIRQEKRKQKTYS